MASRAEQRRRNRIQIGTETPLAIMFTLHDLAKATKKALTKTNAERVKDAYQLGIRDFHGLSKIGGHVWNS